MKLLHTVYSVAPAKPETLLIGCYPELVLSWKEALPSFFIKARFPLFSLIDGSSTNQAPGTNRPVFSRKTATAPANFEPKLKYRNVDLLQPT